MSTLDDATLCPSGMVSVAHLSADARHELHRFAHGLSLPRKHYESEPRPHYDLSEGDRAHAVARGAEEGFKWTDPRLSNDDQASQEAQAAQAPHAAQC